MKKLYTIALAAAVAMTASAAGRQQLASNAVLTPSKTFAEAAAPLKAKTLAKAPAKAATLTDYEGTYDWMFGQLLNNGPTSGEITITVKNAATGEVALTGLVNVSDEFEVALQGFIDVEAGTLSIPNEQELFEDQDGPVFFYLKGVTESGNLAAGLLDVDETVGTISADANTITFPEFEIWAMGDWMYEDFGWYLLTYQNVLDRYVEPADPNEGWEDFCTGTFVDGWIMPGVGATPTSNYPWTVDIQKSTTDNNLYRLNKPYMASDCPLVTEEVMDTYPGYIVFNIADPEYVTVQTGIYGGVMNGTSKLYLFNMEGFYEAQGATKEEVIAGLAAEGITFTPSSFSDATVTLLNCRFDISRACTKAYSWQTQEQVSLANEMVGSIKFDKDPAGIHEVTLGENNGAVEYFNLQGVRVANPENGLYIRRQGNKAEKVLVK